MVEGSRAVTTLLDEGWPLRSLLLSEAKAVSRADLVNRAEDRGTIVYVAPRPVFDRIAGYPIHRGVLGLAERPPDLAVTELVARAARTAAPLLAAEGVNDLENLGALFRNAAAFGVGGVLLDPRSADPLYRRCIRVSLGHVLKVPFARCRAWPEELAAVTAAGYQILALAPDGESTLEEVADEPPAARAVMVGAEGDGLSPAAREAGRTVRIPMAPGVDSVNVATAAAIALHRIQASCLG